MIDTPLLIERDGDAYYVGPLDAGKRAAYADRFPLVDRTLSNGLVLVELHDEPDRASAAEWGAGATEDEAWRYALGALFGPLDAEYDEPALREYLRTLL